MHLRPAPLAPRAPSSARAAAALLAAALATGASPGAAAPPPPAPPWDGPAFEADPRAMLDAADALPPAGRAGVDVLLEEADYAFDARGAATLTYRIVYRPLTPEAVQSWARVERAWSPWHEARPEIRARVITPRGDAHALDPATLAEQGTRPEGGPQGERRVLAGPLPGVRPGAIVEEQAIVRETAPGFDAGDVHRFFVGQPNPVRLSRLRLRAPEALPLRFEVRGVELAPREHREGGVRTLLFERRDAPAIPQLEPFPPSDAPPAPSVAFSTGRSWADVAARLGALADAALAGADLSGPARELARGEPARDELVRRAVAWLHANARATGVELGERPPAPARPADVLRRRQGDAQDLAVLLAGLLRAAGQDARVAYLRARWHDVSPDLPGLGELDHAVVRVEGKPPIWIDPTEPFAAPGELPPAAEGRLALVAGRGTRGLVRTPESPSSRNAAIVRRELALAALGPARIVETRTLGGVLAARERAFRGQVPAARLAELDERYATEVFRAEEHAGTAVEGLAPGPGPVRVRVEAARAGVALTGDDEARIPVAPDPVFDPLPDLFTGPRGPDAKPDEAPARRLPVLLPFAYRAEVVYAIRPPAGFAPRALPRGEVRRFGPAVYEASWTAAADGTVTARFAFDTGGRRLSAPEAEALARDVRAILRAENPSVAFERRGAALLAAGAVREALAEMRRVAAKEPREAAHPLHLALGLLRIGHVDGAAAQARAGIALEPDRAWAHRVLGYVLEHDRVGRHHGPGFDREGAIAAYRAARDLDPDHAGGRAALADLLTFDAAGERFGPGADLEGAIAEFRAIRDDLGNRDHDPTLLATLLAAGRHAEALALARETPASPSRDAHLLAALAIGAGAEAAVAEAAGLGDGRRAALQDASLLVFRQRRYPAASALALAAAQGAPNAAELREQAETFAALTPWEKRAEKDPALAVVREVIVASVRADDPAAALRPLLSARHARSLLAGPEGGAPDPRVRRAREPGVPRDVLLDLLLSRAEARKDGEGGDLRVRVQFPFAPSERGSTMFLVREGKAWKLLGNDLAFPLLAEEALRRAEAGDLAAARRWLEWAREAVPGKETEPATPAGVLAPLWPRGGAPDLARARRAAHALLAFATGAPEVADALEAARAAAPPGPEARALLLALVQAHRQADRWERMLGAAGALLADDPASREGYGAQAFALRHLGRRAELDRATEAALARLPDDPEVLGTYGSTVLYLGDADAAERTWRRLVETGRASPMAYNNAAWMLLRRDPPPPEALDWARRAVDQSRERDRASLNTLAVAYAAAGRPDEAREVFLKSLPPGGPPDPSDWFAFGRIAEAWGEDATALAAYARVEPLPEEEPTSPRSYARARTAAIEARRAAGGPAAGPGPAPAAAPAPAVPPGR